MDVIKRAVAYVIRPNGTIPYDEPHSDAAQDHKAAVLADLAARGHSATHHAEGHLSIHDWEPQVGLKPYPSV